MSTRTAGLLILALGLWGGLVPFVGHYFHFALGPDKSWTWTQGRFYLSVLPGAVAAIGGLMLIASGPRSSARLGAFLALAAGAWFAIGPEVSLLWNSAGAQGVAHGSKLVRVLEMLTYHTALGVLITALAAYALPRFPKSALAAEAGAAGGAAALERSTTRRPQRSAGYRGAAAGGAAAGRRGAVADEAETRRREPVSAPDAPTAVREPREAVREPGENREPREDREPTARDAGYDERGTARDPGYDDEQDRTRDPGHNGEQDTARDPGYNDEQDRTRDLGHNGEAPAHNGEAPTHDYDGSEEPAASSARSDQPAAAPATMRGRRRRGGLLSFLRR